MKSEIKEKSLPRFYCPIEFHDGDEFQLPADVAHHAIKVLRLTPGMLITLFNGTGIECNAQIQIVSKQNVVVTTAHSKSVNRESNLQIHLVQAIASSDKMDLILQKSVALGIYSIQPVETQRGIIKLSGERIQKREQHWRHVVISACEQCGRNIVPQVYPIMPLPTWLSKIPRSAAKFILSPYTDNALSKLEQPTQPVFLLAGPEGGFTYEEEAAARHAGFIALRMGKRVLRTETAALAALAAMQAKWGDF
jgi:16S rRNA (uracil1498-N3)-methyltransferase